MGSRERHVQYSRTTELPTKTYHLTKHHFVPIRYEPGVEVIRRPTVEHKTITSGNLLTGQASNHGFSTAGPRRKETIQITRSPTVTYDDVGGSGRVERKKVVKVVGGGVIDHGVVGFGGGGGGGVVTRTTTSSSSAQQPETFMNMQRSMEGELERRRTDWESEVGKMQHNFFDMKTSEASKNKMKDLRPRGGDILTVGDSHNLYHELPDGSRLYRQKFDLYGFDTSDLAVRAEDGKLIITAAREDDYDGAKSMKQFNRTVDIPETVDQDQISSYLNDEGILTVEAPVVESRVQDQNDSASLIRRTRTEVTEQEPSFSSSTRTRIDDSFPPGFDEVVQTTTSSSSSSNNTNVKAPSSDNSSFSRKRYLGPDVEDTPHGRKLKTTLYIGRKYKAEDITVKLYDYKINVEAKSEEIVAGRTSRRQFARDVDIPGPVERDTFVAMLGTDGKIYIGGSFSGNENHAGVAQSVNSDMPSDGKSVNIMF